ncbi:hypothetical protein TM074_00155 [Candidatus Nanosynbacter sp. TM7-074]|uniref:Uncharacterized protein n=1 Tax=Candidatus Nanosynbacter sp. TM7-074 TaxID=3158573 RepID=A0AB39JCJ0_9BACT
MIQGYISKIVTALLTIGLGIALVGTPVSALGEGGASAGIGAARGDNTPSNLVNGDSSIIKRAINIMLFAVGVLSVVMLIFGGFRYVISGGKKESVTNAKNTILYAIVGLLVAVFAYAIINFILGAALSGGSTTNV